MEDIGYNGRDKEWTWAGWSKVRCLWVGLRENQDRWLAERRVEFCKVRSSNLRSWGRWGMRPVSGWQSERKGLRWSSIDWSRQEGKGGEKASQIHKSSLSKSWGQNEFLGKGSSGQLSGLLRIRIHLCEGKKLLVLSIQEYWEESIFKISDWKVSGVVRDNGEASLRVRDLGCTGTTVTGIKVLG